MYILKGYVTWNKKIKTKKQIYKLFKKADELNYYKTVIKQTPRVKDILIRIYGV